MTVHQQIGDSQPLGYYGLRLTPETRVELAALSYEDLTMLGFQTAWRLISPKQLFSMLPRDADREISELSTAETIEFQRWVSNRLAFLHTEPTKDK